MGRLEKIVVVTVLFLVAVILGISLNSGADNGSEPLAKGRKKTPPPAEAEQDKPVENSAAEKLMVSSLPSEGGTGSHPSDPGQDMSKVAPEPPKPAPVANGFVVTREGLEPVVGSDDFMTYTWKAGDTFDALAAKYYGQPQVGYRLKHANEGLAEATIPVGAKLLVPVTAAGSAQRGAGAPPKDVPQNGAQPAATPLWSGGLYTVKSGEVLGTISKAVYGSAKHWKRIYDANRDVIGEDPNRLKVGMQLRIPEAQ